MAKFLYLLRHSQSADKQPGQPDKERELTPSGIKEALLIGAFLNKENISFDIIFTSTASRARATAQLVTDTVKLDPEKMLADEELFNASVRTFFEFVCRFDDEINSVMCVGHNPVISYLAEYLTKSEIGDMTTGGLAMIKFNIASWNEVSEGNGELIRYIAPAMLVND